MKEAEPLRLKGKVGGRTHGLRSGRLRGLQGRGSRRIRVHVAQLDGLGRLDACVGVRRLRGHVCCWGRCEDNARSWRVVKVA